MTIPTVDDIFNHENDYNILIPSPSHVTDLPEGVKVRISLVKINPDPDEGDIYKVQGGKRGEGGTWIDPFGLSKSALNRILGAMNAKVPAGSMEDIPGQPDVRRWTAIVEHQSMDGTWRTYSGTSELDMDAEVTAYKARLEKEYLEHDGAIKRKIWKKNDQGKSYKGDEIYRGDVAKAIIAGEVTEFDARTRKFAASIVETKAILRAIKGITAIKDKYRPEDLAKPFVVYWYQFPLGFKAEEVASAVFRGGPPHTFAQESGSPSEPSGSHPGPQKSPPPQKPSIKVRLDMLEKSELGPSEIHELVKDICKEKGVAVPDGVDLKMFALGLKPLFS